MSLPVLDQTATTTHTHGTTATITVSTSGASRVLLLFLEVGTTGGVITTTVTSPGLTWAKRASVQNTSLAFALTELWYANAPTQLTSHVITVTTSAAMDDLAMGVASFSGATTALWDNNASVPAILTTGSGTSGTVLSQTISTSQANDIIFGIVGNNTSLLGADITATVSPAFQGLLASGNSAGTHFANIWTQFLGSAGIQTNLVVGVTPVIGNIHSSTYIVDAITGTTVSPPTQTLTVADLWMSSMPDFVDMTVESNRRKFISVIGGAQNLGVNGESPFGGSPPLFLTRDGTAISFAANKGIGGPFGLSSGSLADGASNPPGSTTSATTFTAPSSGKGVLGDYRNGNLYAFNPATLTDNGTSRRWLRRWRALAEGVATTVKFSWLNVMMETGAGMAPDANPQLVLRWSDDGGHVWGPERIVAVGRLGQTSFTVKFNRLGSTRRFSGSNRLFELSSTDPFVVSIIDAEIDAG